MNQSISKSSAPPTVTNKDAPGRPLEPSQTDWPGTQAARQSGEDVVRDLLQDGERFQALLEESPPASPAETAPGQDTESPMDFWSQRPPSTPGEPKPNAVPVPGNASREVAGDVVPDASTGQDDAQPLSEAKLGQAADTDLRQPLDAKSAQVALADQDPLDSLPKPQIAHVAQDTAPTPPLPQSPRKPMAGSSVETLPSPLTNERAPISPQAQVSAEAEADLPDSQPLPVPAAPQVKVENTATATSSEVDGSKDAGTADPQTSQGKPPEPPGPLEPSSPSRSPSLDPTPARTTNVSTEARTADTSEAPVEPRENRIEAPTAADPSRDGGDSAGSDDTAEAGPESLTEDPTTPLTVAAPSASPGDAILQGLQSTEAAPSATPLSNRLEVFREVADRILVSDAAFSGEQEVRVTLKESVLPGTEVRVAQEDGRLVVRLVSESDQSYRILTQQQDALQGYLRDRLDNRSITVELSMENDTQGRSRNRQDAFIVMEDDDE